MARILHPKSAEEVRPKIDLAELKNRKFTMQSLSNASFVQGWIEMAQEGVCAVHVTSRNTPKEGNFYYVEVNGPKSLYSFVGMAEVTDPPKTRLKLSTEISVRHSEVDSRTPIRKAKANLVVDDFSEELEIIDGSSDEIGFECPVPVDVEGSYAMDLDTPAGFINAIVQVTSCGRSSNRVTAYSVLAKFVHMDRISTARWQKLLAEN